MNEPNYNKERYTWYKEHRICVQCGANEAAKKHTRCLECMSKDVEKSIKYQTKNTDKHREYNKQYQRELRAFRKEHGLCQRCGKPTKNNYVFCTEHLAANRIKGENMRRKKGILPRELMGKGEFCFFCGKPVAHKGDKTCPACHARECEWAENMRKRIDYKNHIWRKFNDASFCEHQAKTGDTNGSKNMDRQT